MRYVWIDTAADEHVDWAFMDDDRQAWEFLYDTLTGICYTVPMVMTVDGFATSNHRGWNTK
jgi:hypothetical protein